MINVRDSMRRSANWHRDKLAIISGDRHLTFGEAWDRGLRLANALLDLGLKPKDKVAVLEENCLEASDFLIGTTIGNFIRVPLYKKNAPEAHAHMIRNTGCKALVVDAKHLHEVAGIKEAVPSLQHIIIRDENYESWLASHDNRDPNPEIALDDYHVIRHSGGTTGLPKGMGFTHRAWMNMERDWTYRLPTMEEGDCCVHVGPISHGSGFLFLPLWISGGYNILESKFEVGRVLDLLSEHGGYMFAVPTIISDLVAEADNLNRDFTKLKAIVIGGSPMLPQTALKARRVFGDVLHQMYGQTEATPVVWMTSREWFSNIAGSEPLVAAGKIMPFARVEIRDENNQPVEAGAVGELALQTDGQISEIWDAPELTKQRIVDGWILTGDVGRIDENGYLYLSDRKDDLIISGGFNIWPAELELVIGDLPQVREVVVVRAPHKRFGETPAAVIVLHEGASLQESEVIETCEKRLGKLKRPSIVVFREQLLPRTPVGKIRRNEVRKEFWSGSGFTMGGS
ncbi:class I adenylate-forming enzyme family protein [Polaromonas hydrogenivorans]|uniref:AMP-binding protein n=1 Tax=Polaromonas hydrogenivorans TaxID=335476 RepID=A0AAU7M0H9_9BURK